jgi:hypothetical protein
MLGMRLLACGRSACADALNAAPVALVLCRVCDARVKRLMLESGLGLGHMQRLSVSPWGGGVLACVAWRVL